MNRQVASLRSSNAHTKLLLIDDEAGAWAPPLATALAPFGFDLVDESRAERAYNAVRKNRPDVVLLDLHFPGDERRKDGLTTGADLLFELRQAFPEMPVVIFTTRLQDEKIPLDEFPIQPHGRFGKHQIEPGNDEWSAALARSLRDAIRAARGLQWPPPDDLGLSVATESTMRPFVERIYAAAGGRLNTVIVGEHGVGRLRAARAIHRLSAIANHRATELECEALTADVIAAAANAATEATVILIGLDKVAPAVQGALANWLKASQQLSAASTATRFIATSFAKPSVLAQGRLRADIALAMSEDVLDMPALRHRLDDIPSLFTEFVSHAARRTGKPVTGTLRPEVLARLRSHSWPGNIPELSTVLTRAVAKTTSNVVLPQDIEFSSAPAAAQDQERGGNDAPAATIGTLDDSRSTETAKNALAFLAELDAVHATARYAYLKNNTKGNFRREVFLALISKLSQGGRPVQAKHLADYLDPESPAEAASDRIRQTLKELKIGLRAKEKGR